VLFVLALGEIAYGDFNGLPIYVQYFCSHSKVYLEIHTGITQMGAVSDNKTGPGVPKPGPVHRRVIAAGNYSYQKERGTQ